LEFTASSTRATPPATNQPQTPPWEHESSSSRSHHNCSSEICTALHLPLQLQNRSPSSPLQQRTRTTYHHRWNQHAPVDSHETRAIFITMPPTCNRCTMIATKIAASRTAGSHHHHGSSLHLAPVAAPATYRLPSSSTNIPAPVRAFNLQQNTIDEHLHCNSAASPQIRVASTPAVHALPPGTYTTPSHRTCLRSSGNRTGTSSRNPCGGRAVNWSNLVNWSMKQSTLVKLRSKLQKRSNKRGRIGNWIEVKLIIN